MNTVNEAAAVPNTGRRQVLIGGTVAGVAAVAALAGGAYYQWGRPQPAIPEPPGGADVSIAVDDAVSARRRGARIGDGSRHHRRICLDDVSALRSLSRDDVSGA